MLPVTAILLALLALLMWRVARSTLFAPVLYCAIWSVTLGAIAIAGTIFLRVSEYACLVYLVGATSFALGGAVCLIYGGAAVAKSEQWRTPRAARVVLDVILALLVLLFPYFLHLAVTLAGTSNPIAMLGYIRTLTVQEQGGGSPFGAIANLTVLAPLVALAMTYESDGSLARRSRSVVSLVVALAYGVLTGSKGGALVLVMVFFVTQIRAGRIRIRTAVAALALFLGFFGAGLLAINLGGSTKGDAGVVAQEVGAELMNYLLGSPVAFSAIAQKPDALPSSESIDRFFLQTGNSFGMRNAIPDINPPFTVIETDGENSNTYTIYFSYFKDFGWLGAVLLPAAIGAMLTWVWRYAMAGGPVAVLLYASLCTAVLQSIYAESFFLNINFYVKAIVFYITVYRVLPAMLAALSLRVPQRAEASSR